MLQYFKSKQRENLRNLYNKYEVLLCFGRQREFMKFGSYNKDEVFVCFGGGEVTGGDLGNKMKRREKVRRNPLIAVLIKFFRNAKTRN